MAMGLCGWSRRHLVWESRRASVSTCTRATRSIYPPSAKVHVPPVGSVISELAKPAAFLPPTGDFLPATSYLPLPTLYRSLTPSFLLHSNSKPVASIDELPCLLGPRTSSPVYVGHEYLGTTCLLNPPTIPAGLWLILSYLILPSSSYLLDSGSSSPGHLLPQSPHAC